MATTSQVKTGLDGVSSSIANQRLATLDVKTRLAQISSSLGAIASANSGIISTINSYAVDGTPFEVHAKDELAKLTTEFQTLKAAVDAAGAAIASV